MGKQSSKIKDILYVTGKDLDPPEYGNQVKSQHDKKVEIDYRNFRPKKYYKLDATDEEIEQHEAKLKRKEDILKMFKYHQDFDRINFQEMRLNVTTFEVFVEEFLKISVLGALLVSRMIQVQIVNQYFTNANTLRFAIPCFLISMPFLIQRIATTPEYHIINHEYFRMTDDQIALYQQYHYELDLYRQVDDIKYRFKYPKVKDFYETRRKVLDAREATSKGTFREYYEYKNNLKLDRYEEFIKQRQAQRKGNWSLLTPEEEKQL